MKPVLLLLALAAAPLAPGVALAQVPASAAAFQATTLDLSASGESRVVPDMATLTLGVSTQGKTAAEALSAAAAAMTSTLHALRARGVAERDLQTSGLSLNPQYAYEQGQAPRLTGYEASDQLTILVRDLRRLGETVDAAVSSGANRVNGISFGLADPRSAEDQARRAAVQALTAKAQLYAAATGYAVRRLVSLSEAGGYAPEPRPVMAAASMARFKASTPVEAGELKIRVEVEAVYELGR